MSVFDRRGMRAPSAHPTKALALVEVFDGGLGGTPVTEIALIGFYHHADRAGAWEQIRQALDSHASKGGPNIRLGDPLGWFPSPAFAYQVNVAIEDLWKALMLELDGIKWCGHTAVWR